MSIQENPITSAIPPLATQTDSGATGELSLNSAMIAIAATFTAEPVAEPLEFWIKTLPLTARIEFAPYNHVMQCLLDSGGLFARNKGGMNVVLVRFEDWNRFGEDTNRTEDSLQDKLEEFIGALKAATQKFASPILVCVCPASAEVSNHPERVLLFSHAEKQLLGALVDSSMVRCVSSTEMMDLYPVADYWDPDSDKLGHIPYTPEMFAALGTIIVRNFQSNRRAPFKVIVLDCDNTLWSGVCGEKGAHGVEVDPPRQVLQNFMKDQQSRGMLLCVCSKNTAEDVDAVFDANHGMVLKREDFTGWRVNWQPKSENLRSLADELQLGLDSFLFVDDNPAEIAEVQANCPGVLGLTLPESAEKIPGYLNHIWAFDRFSVTADDKKRAATYQESHLRKKLQAESGSYADFIAGLALQIEIRELSPGEEARAAQLTQRTNQFNAITRRCTEAEIQEMMRNGSTRILTALVRDRLGDYGQVGLIMFGIAGDRLDVRNLMLSCRVLGKGVEHALLAHLGQIARKKSLSYVEVPYLATKKNVPVRDFLASFPLQYREETEQGFVYRFPVEFAAEIKFSPERWEASETGSDAPAGSPKDILENVPERENFHWIAANFDDPRRILEAAFASGRTRASIVASLILPQSEIEKQVTQIWERVLRIEAVGLDNDFFDLGGQSLLAVRVFAEINRKFHLNLGLATIFEARTVRALARLIEFRRENKDAVPADGFVSLVPIQPNGTRPPLFLVHGIGGNILNYEHLVRSLHPDQPAYGIQSRGLMGCPSDSSVEQMAEHYISEIRSLQTEGPYFVCGHSFGGLVAYEIGRKLEAHGQSVGVVGLIDTFQRTVPEATGFPLFVALIRWHSNRLKAHARMLLFGSDRVGYVKARARTAKRRISTFLYERRMRRYKEKGEDLPPLLEDVRQTNWLARNRYEPGVFTGRLVLFRCETRSLIDDPDYSMGWKRLAAGSFQVVEVPGDHNTLMSAPNVAMLAQKLAEFLAKDSQTPSDRMSAAS